MLLVARLALLAGEEDASLVRRAGVVFGDEFSLASVYKKSEQNKQVKRGKIK